MISEPFRNLRKATQKAVLEHQGQEFSTGEKGHFCRYIKSLENHTSRNFCEDVPRFRTQTSVGGSVASSDQAEACCFNVLFFGFASQTACDFLFLWLFCLKDFDLSFKDHVLRSWFCLVFVCSFVLSGFIFCFFFFWKGHGISERMRKMDTEIDWKWMFLDEYFMCPLVMRIFLFPSKARLGFGKKTSQSSAPASLFCLTFTKQ